MMHSDHGDDKPTTPTADELRDDYTKFPIDWEGAPEFQWRSCETVEDCRILVIEHVLPSDIHNPWLYCVVMRARETASNFSQIFTNHSTKDSYGRIELLFPDEHAGGIPSCAINYLIYIRTPAGRSLKIYLPQSPAMLAVKDELMKRLGRVRKPVLNMRRLILKPINSAVIEQEVRMAFIDHDIEIVEFVHDALKQRCAILTFSSAERAISAHCTNSYVFIGSGFQAQGWVKVLYDAVAFKDRGDPECYMLTRAEQRAIKDAHKSDKGKTLKKRPEEHDGYNEEAPPKKVTDVDNDQKHP